VSSHLNTKPDLPVQKNASRILTQDAAPRTFPSNQTREMRTKNFSLMNTIFLKRSRFCSLAVIL